MEWGKERCKAYASLWPAPALPQPHTALSPPTHRAPTKHELDTGKVKTKMAESATYSERFNGGELLHDRLFLGKISCSNGQCGRGNNWQTDRDTDNQEDEDVMEQVVGAVLGSCKLQVMEETADPGNENPADDQDQERRADGVHDSLEMTLILGSRDERCSTTDEGHLGRVGDNGVSLSTLAASSIVDDIGNVFVDSERFSGHGRLINGEKGVAGAVLLFHLIVLVALVLDFLASLSLKLLLEVCPSVGVVVGRDNSAVSGNDLAVFDNDLEKSIEC